MIKYYKDFNGTIDFNGNVNAVDYQNYDITNNNFNDYFLSTSTSYTLKISGSGTHLALCVAENNDVTVTVESIDYKIPVLGVLIIPVSTSDLDVTFASSSQFEIKFMQLCNEVEYAYDYNAGFTYAELCNARTNSTQNSWGAPSGTVQTKRAIPVSVNFPNVHSDDMFYYNDFLTPENFRLADFDGVQLCLFDIIVNTVRHDALPNYYNVSVKYKVWGN